MKRKLLMWIFYTYIYIKKKKKKTGGWDEEKKKNKFVDRWG